MITRDLYFPLYRGNVGDISELDIFSSIREPFRKFARDVCNRNSKILLISKSNIIGALTLAPIEAVFLDSAIPYRRRFTDQSPDSETIVHVLEDPVKGKDPNNEIAISEFVVEGLRGSSGDSRKGPLCTVAQAHFLANEINPGSVRLRRLRPWILSGNWIGNSLDRAYDPVYSFLRDFLSEQGVIRVVPVTEVKSPESGNYPWIEDTELLRATDLWQTSNLEKREKIMAELAMPIFDSKAPSTVRVEELLWHCVIGPNWESDLSSQIFRANSFWNKKKPVEAANEIADLLVSKGQI